EFRKSTDRFRRAKTQIPSGLERVMEDWDHAFLQARFEVDQQIAATDQVHAGERRIADHVLPGKDDDLAQGLVDAISSVLLNEEPPQPLSREVLGDALRVESVPRFVEQRIVEVGRE